MDRLKTALETSVLDHLPHLVSCLDLDFRYRYVNRAYENWFKIEAKTIIGKRGNEIVGDAAFEKVLPFLIRARNGELVDYDLDMPYQLGKRRYIHGILIPEKDSAGKTVGIIVMVREMTESEKNIEAITETLDFGMWDWDIANDRLNWDENLYRLYGVDQSTFGGAYETWEKCVHPEDKEKATEKLRESLDGNRPFDTSFRIVHRNGRIRHVGAKGWVERDKSGKPIRMTGFNWNMTALSAEKEKNEALTEKISNIADNLPGLIFQFQMFPDGSTTMPYVVTAGLKLFDVTEEDYRRDNNLLIKLVHSDERENLQIAINKSSSELTRINWSGRIVTKAGKLRWIHAQGVPKRLSDGSTLWDGLLMDVSREKQLESDFLNERAKSIHNSKLAALGTMAAGIAHEINNPLAIIKGFSETLHRYKTDDEKFDQRISSINKSIERISKIIVGLRKFSRDNSKDEKSAFTVNSCIDESLILTLAKAKKFDVQVDLKIESRAEVFGNSTAVEQTLVNLLTNAIDAVSKLPERWIRIHLFENSHHVVCRVTDSGRGIPPEVRSKIFDPFYTTKSVNEGTGLGLSISKSIIEEIGGTLNLLEDTPNTCFEFALPRLETHLKSAA